MSDDFSDDISTPSEYSLASFASGERSNVWYVPASTGSVGGPLWVYLLPDCLHCLSLSFLESQEVSKPELTAYGQLGTQTEDLVKPVLLELNQDCYFCKSELTTLGGTSAIVWVQVDRITASSLLEGKKPPYAIFGLVSNMFRRDDEHFGLYSLVQLEYYSPFRAPRIVQANDDWTAYPGLKNLVNTNPETCARLGSDPMWDELLEFEHGIPYRQITSTEVICLSGDWTAAVDELEQVPAKMRLLPRVQYVLGCIYEGIGDFEKALTHFNCSQRNGHLYAYQRELRCHGALTKPLRDRYPSAFKHIERGEGARALTTLRTACSEYPVTANSVLAYCLRHTGNPEEGLAAAAESLSINPIQSDTLGHKWLFETELELDSEALNTACDHLTLYPLDSGAATHCIDSLLLLGREPEAIQLVNRYLITAASLEHALYYLFKVYELSEMWQEAGDRFKAALRGLRAPTPDTLCRYGEILIELGSFEEALTVFEKALAVTPGSVEVVLGYARALCRGEREDEAEELLQTVLQDVSRVDQLDGRCFLITLLAEVRRRTGRPEESLATFEEFLDQDLVALSEQVGPLPALEYAEALAALGRTDEARVLIKRLHSVWPEDPFVNELDDILRQ